MKRAAIDNLRRILSDTGTRILDEPLRVEGWLSDYGRGGLKLENFALVTALRENVPQALLTAAKNGSMDVMTGLLVEKLRKSRGLAPEVCAWAVAAWIEALGLHPAQNKLLDKSSRTQATQTRPGRSRFSEINWLRVLLMAVAVDLIILVTAPFIKYSAHALDTIRETSGPVLMIPFLFLVTTVVLSVVAWFEARP